MSNAFADRVAHLKDGWAVRFKGCIEGARWRDENAARIHLELLKSGYRKPQPEIRAKDKRKSGRKSASSGV